MRWFIIIDVACLGVRGLAGDAATTELVASGEICSGLRHLTLKLVYGQSGFQNQAACF